MAIWIDHHGQRKTMRQWALQVGIDPKSLAHRIKSGWPLEKALTQPKTATGIPWKPRPRQEKPVGEAWSAWTNESPTNSGFLDDLAGKVFGRLTVIKYSGSRKWAGKKAYATYWVCRCECGKEHTASRSHLVTGNVKSCGCLKHSPRHTWNTKKSPGRLQSQLQSKENAS